ncbi:MAG: hypothetical protein LBU48_01715 [Coriobacteriales bacterium]|jgi:hypothetical protein|nr:hypothetical protein [Coriobacteriales bacterium]
MGLRLVAAALTKSAEKRTVNQKAVFITSGLGFANVVIIRTTKTIKNMVAEESRYAMSGCTILLFSEIGQWLLDMT